MLLKSIHMGNIRSFKDEKIEFPQGSVLLSGNVGAGKSTILLAIDFALFGTRRGELNGSDLLRHGEDQGFVELEFDVDGKDIVIKRALKRSKSVVQDSGYMTINGRREEHTATGLKAMMLELFGYPKGLLKKNNPIFRYTVYTPQEQMKHILLFPEDRLETLRKIFDVEKYGRIRTNAKLFTTELRTMKRELDAFVRDLDDRVKEMDEKGHERVRIENQVAEQVNIVRDIDERLEKKRLEMDTVKLQIEEMNKLKQGAAGKETELRMKNSMLEKVKNETTELEFKIASNNNQIKQYEDIEEPARSEGVIKDNIFALERERDLLISKKAVVADEIIKLEKIYEKGICDFCEQRVHDPEHFKVNIDKKSASGKEIDEKIGSIDNGIEELKEEHTKFVAVMVDIEKKKHLEKDLDELLKNKEKLESDLRILDDEITFLQRDVALLKPRIDAYKGIEERGVLIEKVFYEVQNEKIVAEKERSRIEQQMIDIGKLIAMLKKEISEKKKSKEKIEQINALINWFDSYFINLMMIIEKNVMMTIQKEFNSLFQNWFNMIMGDDLIVRIDEQFSPIIEQNGYETDYQNLSGGEKTSVALAYRLALNKVINSLIETIKTRDLLILDEPTDGFSADQLDRIRDVINELDLRQIIIVSHEPKIDTFVDNVIRLSKDQHVSTAA